MKTSLMKAFFILVLFVPGFAFADVIKKPSQHSVKDTMDKFETLIKSKGLTVFVRVDHTKNAKGIDVVMNDAEVIVFGNPKIGSVLMQKDPAAALDLPLKVSVYKDDSGKVWLSYRNPQDFSKDYNLTGSPVLGKVETTLDGLTNAVIK